MRGEDDKINTIGRENGNAAGSHKSLNISCWVGLLSKKERGLPEVGKLWGGQFCKRIEAKNVTDCRVATGLLPNA